MAPIAVASSRLTKSNNCALFSYQSHIQVNQLRGMKTVFSKEMAHKVEDPARLRVLTPSFVLSATRMASSPAIAYMLLNNMHDKALLVFAAATLTDLAERFIRNRTYSDQMMDVLADRTLIATCLVSLFYADIITIYIVKGNLYRDAIAFAATISMRYLSISEQPLKKFFKFNKYPSLGYEPPINSKVHTITQYLALASLMATGHNVGTDEQYWFMVFVGTCTAVTSLASSYSLISKLLGTGAFESMRRSR